MKQKDPTAVLEAQGNKMKLFLQVFGINILSVIIGFQITGLFLGHFTGFILAFVTMAAWVLPVFISSIGLTFFIEKRNK